KPGFFGTFTSSTPRNQELAKHGGEKAHRELLIAGCRGRKGTEKAGLSLRRRRVPRRVPYASEKMPKARHQPDLRALLREPDTVYALQLRADQIAAIS